MTVNAQDLLAHYRLLEKIGEGGMGIVWKAFDTHLDREVAIKILPEQAVRDPERLERFEMEFRHAIEVPDSETGFFRGGARRREVYVELYVPLDAGCPQSEFGVDFAVALQVRRVVEIGTAPHQVLVAHRRVS